MQTPPNGIRWWFESLDKMRRRRGNAMDQIGYGPSETPYQTALNVPGVRLRYYGGTHASRGIALIVPAPIKRHYIWDLAPDCSVVQRALQADMHVYLAEWTDPPGEQGQLGLADYAYRLLDQCVRAVRTTHLSGQLFLLSHSLGGVFAAIYSAMRPEQVAALVLVESPLHFGDASGSFAPLVTFGPSADKIVRIFDKVPGSVLNMASVIASPATFNVERYGDFVASLGSSKLLRTHMLVERWMLDEAPMQGRLFEQVVEDIYRRDSLMKGLLTIAGRTVSPEAVTVPLLSVYDPHSVVIPPDSVIAFHEAAGSRQKRLLSYEGDTGVALAHVGALMGENAHRHLWPEILRWLGEIGAQRH
ncbi:MAG TPA: alpha/beta fold hydrolase [Noviherbaspirillum sp.]|nr:alpha/beta fold hydrolase [Noviherbaspirillum sp.]